MKKEDNTKLTVDEILEEIENAGLDTPKMQCSICGKEKPAHAVYTLPEVWRHGRRLALYMLGKAPRPEPVDEEAMMRKYGYTARDVFCVDCWISSWMVRINTECQPINKLVKTINMKNIGLDRLIGPVSVRR